MTAITIQPYARKTFCSTKTRITFVNHDDLNQVTLWCIFRKKKKENTIGYAVVCYDKNRNGLEFWMNAMLDDDGNQLSKPAEPTEEDAVFYMSKVLEFLFV